MISATKNVLIALFGGWRVGSQAWSGAQAWGGVALSNVLLIKPSLWVFFSLWKPGGWASFLFKGLKQGPDICSLTSLTYR